MPLSTSASNLRAEEEILEEIKVVPSIFEIKLLKKLLHFLKITALFPISP